VAIYGVLLAAGLSSRMGQPKQLLPWAGRPLVRHVAEAALASRLTGLLIVLGAAARSARSALHGLQGPVQLVECAEYPQGQAASLRCGLNALPRSARAAVVLLVDMPLVGAPLIDQLLDAYTAAPESLAVIPRFEGRRGNPVLLAAALFPEVLALEGDVGARSVLERHTQAVRWLDVADPAVVTDLDTPEAYESIQQRTQE
jgi:molybdenum cofactor cytidylyltransferase